MINRPVTRNSTVDIFFLVRVYGLKNKKWLPREHSSTHRINISFNFSQIDGVTLNGYEIELRFRAGDEAECFDWRQPRISIEEITHHRHHKINVRALLVRQQVHIKPTHRDGGRVVHIKCHVKLAKTASSALSHEHKKGQRDALGRKEN